MITNLTSIVRALRLVLLLRRRGCVEILSTLFLALCTSSWTAPASAGVNVWSWGGGFFPGPQCQLPGLEGVKDCFTAWTAVVGSNAHCGMTGEINQGPIQTQPNHWWAHIVVTTGGRGTDCSGPLDSYYTDYTIDATCPPGMTYDPLKAGCGPPQRADANGCLSKGNPCDVLIGNKRQDEVDYAAGAGGLSFKRTYNSSNYRSVLPGPYGTPLGEQASASPD